ncbi:M56 family metallopeptidase [Flavivirga aquimarina]|uniref:M56 family metallopeptidase n=1 Tax=Flavivirga aquimarina TaxID=2027862 RepID=A0ABT8WFX3_9FLAO|nr:M56 family metallopeptidase [Flavivirga aquimarina]MDO5972016.1 M56 family metallopeptidase [Flavivirga aquimarina]
MEYLLKASAVITIFYLCYKLFLQLDTFFEANRGFLLLGLITAFTIPFLVIPIYIEYSPTPITNYELGEDLTIIETTEKPFNIFEYIPFVYLLGIVFFTLRFLFQFVSLSLILINNKKENQDNFKLIETKNTVSPFSFFNWIVYNPTLFNTTELEQIITHEKVHARQYHSIDILLMQLACIVLWFNPFVWLYNKDLKQNLEFIADQNAQRQSHCKKSYQCTLLKASISTHQITLSNNFYNSLIKKRIIMLQKSKSKKSNLFKYALVLPFLALLLMSYNTEEVYVETSLEEESKIIKNDKQIFQKENDEFIVNGTVTDIYDNPVPKSSIEIKETLPDVMTNSLGKLKPNVLEPTTIKSGNTSPYIIDGEELSKKDFKKIAKNNVYSTTVLKDTGYISKNGKPINSIKNQEEFIILGKVMLHNKIGLENSSVTIKEKSRSVITDSNGNYKIRASIGDKITFSRKSLVSKEVEVKNKENINVILRTSNGLSIDASNPKKPIYYLNDKKISKKEFGTILHDSMKKAKSSKNDKPNSKDANQNENTFLISGIVSNKKGKPIQGAMILNGSSNGVMTNSTGKYAIKAIEGDELVFSFKDMETQKFEVKKNKTIDVNLAKKKK